MTAETTHDLPVACTLTDEERRERAGTVQPLLSRAEEICELDDGYAFRLPATAENASELLDFVMFERRCCAFLSYELIFEPGLGPLWLQLRGSSAGAKEFVAGFVDPKEVSPSVAPRTTATRMCSCAS